MTSKPSLLLLSLPPLQSGQAEYTIADFKASFTSDLTRCLSFKPAGVNILLSVTGRSNILSRRRQFKFFQTVLSLLYSLSVQHLSASGLDIEVDVLLLCTRAGSPGTGPVLVTAEDVIENYKLGSWKGVHTGSGTENDVAVQAVLRGVRPGGAGYNLHTWSNPPASIHIPFEDPDQSDDKPEHSVVAVGGTFDHLHPGHKLLLTMTAFVLSREASKENSPLRLIIGITGPALLKNKKHASQLSTYESRTDSVLAFLSTVCLPSDRPKFISNTDQPKSSTFHMQLPPSTGCSILEIYIEELEDPCGPTITVEACSALVVSGETSSGGKVVNDKRREKAWSELEIFEVDVLVGDNGEKLSSTELRAKAANKDGQKSKV